MFKTSTKKKKPVETSSAIPPVRPNRSNVPTGNVVPVEINWAPKPLKSPRKSHKPTRGLIQRPHQAVASGPASLRATHLKPGNWDRLGALLKPITNRNTVPLMVTGTSIKAAHFMDLQQPDLLDWQTMIETLVLHGEADAARRLLAMCTDTTLFALLTDLSPHCLGAMAANDDFVARKLFIDLLYGTATKAADARHFALVSRLLTHLPPKERARLILKFPDATRVPAAPVGGKPSLELAKGDIDEETWFMVRLALEETVAEQQRRQDDTDPPPMLRITTDAISTAQPQMASWNLSNGFSQAIGTLLGAKQYVKACDLLLMCSPLARAYVFQALMASSEPADSCFNQLASIEVPEVRALLEQAVAGCLGGVAGFSAKDAQKLDETLMRLRTCQKSWANAKAGQANRFWRAYDGCSPEERKRLDNMVPPHWLGLKAVALDLSTPATRVRDEITAAFKSSVDAGLLACEAAMKECEQWKEDRPWVLLTRGIVTQALKLWAGEKVASKEGLEVDNPLTPEQDMRVAALNEWSWIGPLTSRDLRSVSAVPDVCDMLLQAAVEQAINAESAAERRNYVQGLGHLCRQLHKRDTPMERHLACRLNEYLRQGLNALLTGTGDRDEHEFLEAQLRKLPPLIEDVFLAASDVSDLVQLGHEGAANEYLDLVERTLTEQMGANGWQWSHHRWTAIAGDNGLQMRQRWVAEQAIEVLKSCSNADKRPLLPMLEQWLANEALPLKDCDQATLDAIKACAGQAWAAKSALKVWSAACGTLAQTRGWMQDLYRLSQRLPDDERRVILERLGGEAFAQWLDAVQQSGEQQRVALEEALAQVLGSEHLNADVGDWMVKVLGHPSGPGLPYTKTSADQLIQAPEASLLQAALARLILSPDCNAQVVNRVLTAMGPRIDLLPVLLCPLPQPGHPGRPDTSGIDRLLRLCDILSQDPHVMKSLSSLKVKWSLAWQAALYLGGLMAERRAQGGGFTFDAEVISTVGLLPAFDGARWRPGELLFKPLWEHAVVNGLNCPVAFSAWYLQQEVIGGQVHTMHLFHLQKAQALLHWMPISPLPSGEPTDERLGALRCRLMLAWCDGYRFMKATAPSLKPAFADAMRDEHAIGPGPMATAMVAAVELSARRTGTGGGTGQFLDADALRDLAIGWHRVLEKDENWLSSLPKDIRVWVQSFADTAFVRVDSGDQIRAALVDRLREQWPALPPDSDAWRERFEQYARSAGKGG